MASNSAVTEGGGTWLIDSGCSNHMSGDKMLFQRIDEAPNQTIRLGDGKILQVAGVGIIALRSSAGTINTLTNVQYVPNLAHNLLSVGQLMASGYSVEFFSEECVIRDISSNTKVAKIHITMHILFPLDADDVGAANVAQEEASLSELLHKRYGHLNFRSLKLLSKKQLVKGLPSISSTNPCEVCTLGKQTRLSFPKDRQGVQVLH